MKIRWEVCLLLCTTFLTGCYSYRDIDRALFCTGIIIDVNKEGYVVLYSELFHSYRSKETNNEKGTRLVFTSTGRTLMEAVRNQNKNASHKISYEQNKVIVFTKRAAEYGIDNFIDFLNRDQELLLRQYILLYEGDPRDLIGINIKQEEYLGLYIFDLVRNEIVQNFADIFQVYKYLNDRYIGNEIEVMAFIKIKKEELQDDVIIDGAGILKKGKLIEIMEASDAVVFSGMMGKGSSKLIIIPHPNYKDKHITLEVLSKGLKTFIKYDKGKIILEKIFDVRVTFAESEKEIELDDPKKLKEIEKTAEEEVKKLVSNLFEKYKEKDLDIFRIEELLSRKYPNEDIKNPLRRTELKVEADVSIEGSTDVQDLEDD